MNRFHSRVFFLALLIFGVFGTFKAQTNQNTRVCGVSEVMDHALASDAQMRARFAASLHDNDLRAGGADSAPVVVIPVVFHVFHFDGLENISDAQCQSQIDVLNEDFGSYGLASNSNPLSADTRIRFCLANVDPDGNPSTGVNRIKDIKSLFYDVELDEEYIMKLSQWDTKRYLNIWTVNNISFSLIGGSLEAYSYYPPAVAGTWRDGIMTRYYNVGRIELAIGMGRVISHEVGHYLNLLHPWGLRDEYGCEEDDGVEDTPLCEFPFYTIAPFCDSPNQCGTIRQVENIMDYSADDCRRLFTYGQSLRMRSAIYQYRPDLVSGQNSVRTQCDQLLTIEPSTEDVILFPNPTLGNFMVYIDQISPDPFTLELYGTMGNLIYRQVENSPVRGAVPVYMEGLNAGVYWVFVKTQTKWYKKQIVLLK